MAVNAGDIVFNITGDASGLNNAVSNAVKSVSSNLSQISTAAGTAMTAAGTAITGALALATKSAVTFHSEMAKVATLGVKDLGVLKDAVRDVAKTFGLDLTDAINATYDALSSGVTEAEIPNILTQAAKAATAGVTDLNTAIKLGTSVSNAYGTSMKDMGTVFDQAFIAAKVGVTTFEELAASVGEVAPTMAAAKLKSDEMFASIAALTLGGMSTSKAANSMNAALSNIIKPSAEASKLAQQLGLDFSVTALSSKGLAGFLDDVKTATGGDVVAMGTLFGSSEALSAMLSLTGNQAKAFTGTLEQMKTGAGATQEAFDAFVAANPGQGWAILGAQIKDVAITIGDALLPSLKSILEQITPYIAKVAEWIKQNPELTATITKVALVVGALMLALGPLLIALPGIVAGFGAVMGVLGALAAFLGGGWIVAIVAAVIAGLVALAAAFYFYWDEICAATVKFGDYLYNILADAGEWLLKKWDEVWKFVTEHPLDAIQEILGFLLPGFDEMMGIIGYASEWIGASFDETWNWLVESAWWAWDSIVATISSGVDSALYYMQPLITAMQWLMSPAASAASAAAQYMGGVAGGGAMMPQSPAMMMGGQGFGGGGTTNTNTANVNISMGGVSVANDQDARKLSKMLATQMRTELRGLGYAT